MRKLPLIALLAALAPSVALAQTPLPNPLVLGPNTIVGRGNIGTGYAYAMTMQEFVATLSQLGISTAAGTAGGDLSGSYPNPTVAKLNGTTPPNSGLFKGNGAGGVVAATSGTDYAPATSGSSILKGSGAGGFASAIAGTDFQAVITQTGALKGTGSGGIAQAACADLTNASASCSTDATNATNIGSGTLAAARLPSPFTSGTASGNTSQFATVAAGAKTSGHVATWDASGNVQDGGAAATGTITGVTAGTGLSGGGTSGTVTVNCQAITSTQAGCHKQGFGVSYAPANPTGTTSTIGVMMGVGATCVATPQSTGVVSLEIKGTQANNTANNYSTVQFRYGTGTAPTNGAAATGTTVGGTISQYSVGATNPVFFSTGGIVTLVVGTTYWFDLSLAAQANTASVAGLTCIAHEIN